MRVKLLGVGSPIVDVLARVSDGFAAGLPGGKGGMELVSAEELSRILVASGVGKSYLMALGGSAANTVFGLANLGVSTALLGKLGDDADGEFYRRAYTKIGGDDSRFKFNAATPTGRCLSLVTPDSERTMRTDLGAAATLVPEDLASADFAGVPHVHIEGYLLFNRPLTIKALELAKAAGCVVSLDMAAFSVVEASKDILPDLLAEFVDVVFANEDEAAAFVGSRDADFAAAELAKLCGVAAVKLGRDGALIKRGGETVRVAARLVDAVDTTGAGDLWQAGFLYGLLAGWPLEDCGEAGAILGAEVVQIMGAAIPEERWVDIRGQVDDLANRHG